MRILIVKISAMGDVLHALPVLDYLRRAAPGSEIDWVVEEAFADLLRHNPLIARLHTVAFKRWKRAPLAPRTIREVLAARRGLAERRYDLVLDIQGNIKSGLVAFLAGVPRRVGFSRDFTQEGFNALCSTERVRPRDEDRHITDQYLRLASAPFGGDFDPLALESDVVPGPGDQAAADAILAGCAGHSPLVLFHTGTTWQTKFWHEEGWIELGRRLHAARPGSLVLLSWGSEAERQAAQRIAAALGEGALVLDRLPLLRLAALIRRIDLVVGGDTGVVHLAAAVGTATLSYYRSSDGSRSGPRGPRHLVVQAPMACARCFRTRCDRDDECRASITPQALAAGIETLLSRKEPLP